MNRQRYTPSGLFSLSALAAGVLLCSTAAAQEWTPPQTEHGYPDLQGVWNIATVTMLERPPAFDKLELTPEEAETIGTTGDSYLDELTGRDGSENQTDDVGGYNTFWMDPGERMAMIDGKYRTSIIVEPENGRLPWSPGGRGALMSRPEGLGPYDGPEARGVGERCLVGFGSSGGPPMLPVLYNNHSQIVQTEDYVVILAEMNHDARIVRLNDDEHIDRAKWLGDSIGYYEGDTLVVETTNWHEAEAPRGALRHFFFVSPDAKVTERFTRTAEDQILYEFTVDDPVAYTQPWKGELPMRAVDEQIYEYACHEGNYALPGILAGARRGELDDANEAASDRADTRR